MAQRLIVEALNVGARVTLRGRRRVYAEALTRSLDTLPAEWRALLAQWMRRAPRAKWPTLLADAGHSRVELARTLMNWLLEAGWIVAEETRSRTGWAPLWIEFRQPAELRSALGLADPEKVNEQWAMRRAVIANGFLRAHLDALDQLPAKRAVERAELLESVQRWGEDGRRGTRRDFALFARGATKQITAAEWQWLQSQVDLEASGIERHAPQLCLRAPVVLVTDTGAIDLQAAPDFVGLSIATVKQSRSIIGSVRYWRVIENRTSFERAARTYGAEDAVVWVPGFAPRWWLKAVAALLALAPAGALIACDPDPSGVEIALDVGKAWESVSLDWAPWQMSPAALESLPARRSLSMFDRAKLQSLRRRALPAELEHLVTWMTQHNQKGEQEGLI